VCTDPSRDRAVLCIVAEAADLMALERANDFRGLYHVLGGLLSPLHGMGPDDLSIPQLLERLLELQPDEIIIATPALG